MREWKDEVVFLRKIVRGGADQSYGIQVARLAGLPKEVLERAKYVLSNLEKSKYDEAGQPSIAKPADGEGSPADFQMDLFFAKKEYLLADELASLDPMNMTPIESLAKLGELVEKAARLKE